MKINKQDFKKKYTDLREQVFLSLVSNSAIFIQDAIKNEETVIKVTEKLSKVSEFIAGTFLARMVSEKDLSGVLYKDLFEGEKK